TEILLTQAIINPWSMTLPDETFPTHATTLAGAAAPSQLPTKQTSAESSAPKRSSKAAEPAGKRISTAKKSVSYADAGVDISSAERSKQRIKMLARKTFNRQVLSEIGGFGGLFALDLEKYPNPVLVSSADGVGTKLKVAFELGIHHTVGQDLVNHCVNDIAVQGAT